MWIFFNKYCKYIFLIIFLVTIFSISSLLYYKNTLYNTYTKYVFIGKAFLVNSRLLSFWRVELYIYTALEGAVSVPQPSHCSRVNCIAVLAPIEQGQLCFLIPAGWLYFRFHLLSIFSNLFSGKLSRPKSMKSHPCKRYEQFEHTGYESSNFWRKPQCWTVKPRVMYISD